MCPRKRDNWEKYKLKPAKCEVNYIKVEHQGRYHFQLALENDSPLILQLLKLEDFRSRSVISDLKDQESLGVASHIRKISGQIFCTSHTYPPVALHVVYFRERLVTICCLREIIGDENLCISASVFWRCILLILCCLHMQYTKVHLHGALCKCPSMQSTEGIYYL